jgi:mannose-6-phosphate isomerase-like protein (cupin superfamily)
MKKISLEKVKEQEVSHNPEILKKVMIHKAEFNNIMNFGHTRFTPNQCTSPHYHEDMNEVFFVIKGKGIFYTYESSIEVEQGDCITIPAKEVHWQSNPYKTDLEMVYFGVIS